MADKHLVINEGIHAEIKEQCFKHGLKVVAFTEAAIVNHLDRLAKTKPINGKKAVRK